MTYADIKDKVVMITGAAGGIGAGLCDRFNSLGARVYSTDIAGTDRPRFTQGDISDQSFRALWVQEVLGKEGRIDVLVNNAGICPRTALPDVTVAEWNKVLDINLTSAFALSQMVVDEMIRQRSGAIINLASMAGKIGGIAVGAHYSASKAGIICLTKTLARHAAPHGVRVNAVAPGIIDTDITRAATPEQVEGFKNTIPLGRVGSVDEVVAPIVFLASSEASYITGSVIDVNGGLLMD
ncbi:MAG: SDR family NAD(P)-dependent oxidoreductase [Armatimonadota bacterium]